MRPLGFSHASGVYRIVNMRNGKVYVGSSRDVASRIINHRDRLAAGNHPNRHLQRAWHRHGAEAFVFAVIELVSPSEIWTREQFHIDQCGAADPAKGYNGVQHAIPGRSKKSSAHRASMAAAARRRWATMSPEVRESLLAKQRARAATDETRARLSTVMRTSEAAQQHCRDLASGQRGVPLSDDHRRNVSLALKGRPHSAAHIAAIAAAKQRKRASAQVERVA